MRLLPELNNNRPLAIGLLLAAALVVYLVGFHWFVQRHLVLGQEVATLERQVARYKAAVARGPQLSSRLAELREEQLDSALFLRQSNFNTAAAAMVRRLREVIESQSDEIELCTINATQNRPDPEPERFERVTVNVRMNCPLPDLVRIFYALENSVPLLFIDELMINQRMSLEQRNRRRGVGAYGQLDVRFDLFGFLFSASEG